MGTIENPSLKFFWEIQHGLEYLPNKTRKQGLLLESLKGASNKLNQFQYCYGRLNEYHKNTEGKEMAMWYDSDIIKMNCYFEGFVIFGRSAIDFSISALWISTFCDDLNYANRKVDSINDLFKKMKEDDVKSKIPASEYFQSLKELNDSENYNWTQTFFGNLGKSGKSIRDLIVHNKTTSIFPVYYSKGHRIKVDFKLNGNTHTIPFKEFIDDCRTNTYDLLEIVRRKLSEIEPR